jgi:putative intracellular protease/amidase
VTKKTLAFVVYPGISLLELVGNCSVLGLIMGLGPLLKWQARYDPVVVGERVEAIPTDTPMAIIPQKTFADIPQPEGLVVIGGGVDTLPVLGHAELLAYVRRAGENAEWVAATSTGALLLAAAGLLKGRLATTHWAYAGRLEAYGVHYQPAASTNWVTDGKFTTAAGVSGAIDMAIGLGARLTNRATAQFAQLGIEYDPHPPLGRLDWTTFERDQAALARLLSQHMASRSSTWSARSRCSRPCVGSRPNFAFGWSPSRLDRSPPILGCAWCQTAPLLTCHIRMRLLSQAGAFPR